jgi:hypothetical protein
MKRSFPDTSMNRRSFVGGAAAGGLAGGVAVRLVSTEKHDAPELGSPAPPPQARLFTFSGGDGGPWSVVDSRAIVGEPLPAVRRLDIANSPTHTAPPGTVWSLRGVTSNARYITRAEKDDLVAKQAELGRTEATLAALIPIRKSAAWWSLPQDERRAIFEERSHHVKTGMKYLPAIARRLHHCRDLGTNESFDFLTFFDYARADAGAFDEMLAALRASEEWKYVDREVDIRLVRA